MCRAASWASSAVVAKSRLPMLTDRLRRLSRLARTQNAISERVPGKASST
jgi:hypothetical protein